MRQLVRYYVMARPIGWWGPVRAEAERLGLIAPRTVTRHSLLKRQWSAEEADEWTREDWLAILISPLAYMALMLGVALALLRMWSGVLILIAGIVLTAVMHWIIDPKLKAVSAEYEKKQKVYLEQLDRIIRWEDAR
jgi:small-conductance mechanosensitive channel